MIKNCEELTQKAVSFINNYFSEMGGSKHEIEERVKEVSSSILKTGTYSHTLKELEYGAKIAWRNSSRCIGRLFWDKLKVFDGRMHLVEEEIFESLLLHIDYATNNGIVRPSITVFTQKTEEIHVRIWNHQLIRYAGYETKNGIIGDPASVEFTKQCMMLGWKGKGTSYDVLPVVIQVNSNNPKWFDIPIKYILEVPFTHPKLMWFEELNLKWYGVPFVSDMLLEIGGIHYTAAPFNGWYMATEISARNLADESRYNKLPEIALRMELDITKNTSFWKDRALIELNEAIYYSFRKHKVNIVDHHTASDQFELFTRKEIEVGREVNGNWSWLIPPLSPATTSIWSTRYREYDQSPNYFKQKKPYNNVDLQNSAEEVCPYHSK